MTPFFDRLRKMLGNAHQDTPDAPATPASGRDTAPARDVEDLTRPLARPAVGIVATDGEARSYFGGSPRLPVGVEWPSHGGAPLPFLARISLRELHAAHRIEWLPQDGALLFFYDTESFPCLGDEEGAGGWRVLAVPDLDAPINPALTNDAPASSGVRHRRIAFECLATLPSTYRDETRALQFTSAERDANWALRSGLFPRDEGKHWVGGWPNPIQGDDMELECQYVSHGLPAYGHNEEQAKRAEALKTGAADWRLLLQLDSDRAIDACWGDVGTIYFWIREEDARAGRFEKVLVDMACC